MKLATLKTAERDGRLVVVNRGLTKAKVVPEVALTLQEALDHWTEVESQLQQVYQAGKMHTAQQLKRLRLLL